MAGKIKSITLLTLTAMIWGFAFVAQTEGAEFLHPFSFNGIRFMMGALSLLPVILFFEKGKTDKKTLKSTVILGIVAGTVLFSASSFQQFGIVITEDTSKSAFITGLYTVLVPIIYFCVGRKTGINVWIGAALSAVGLYLLCGVASSSPFGAGDMVLLVCAVLFSLHIIILDKAGGKVRALRFSAVQFFTCSVLSLCASLIFEKGNLTLVNINAAIVPLLFGGIGSVGIAYTCQLLGQKNFDPTAASMIMCTESLFGAVGAAIVLGERMEISGYIGGALMFAGIVFSQLNINKKSTAP